MTTTTTHDRVFEPHAPETPASTRESPQRKGRKALVRRESPPIPAQPASAKTGLSAGGRGFESRRSRKSPANQHMYLTKRPPASLHPAEIPRQE